MHAEWNHRKVTYTIRIILFAIKRLLFDESHIFYNLVKVKVFKSENYLLILIIESLKHEKNKYSVSFGADLYRTAFGLRLIKMSIIRNTK